MKAMSRIKKFLKYLATAILVIVITGWSWLRLTDAEAADLKDLKRGDIIFQTSNSSQSLAILLASKSAYSHMGLIDFDKDGAPVVLEATATTRSTPLPDWVARGVGKRIAVYRVTGLTDQQANQAAAEARTHFGKGYDLFFFNGDAQLYCSELVWLAFKAAGVELGKFQSVGTLDLDNFAARKVIGRRWQRYPLCADGKEKDFESCLRVIKSQTLITPEAIAVDGKLELIYSNYAP
jgi:uncharacterized protein YycO